MNKTLSALFVGGLLAGCAPDNLIQPTFPAVAPEKPATVTKAETRPPVSAKDVNERNARQVLRELNAEMELDTER